MKTSLYLNKKYQDVLQKVGELVPEKRATILRMALWEGFSVLIKRHTPEPAEKKDTQSVQKGSQKRS